MGTLEIMYNGDNGNSCYPVVIIHKKQIKDWETITLELFEFIQGKRI